MRLENKTIYVNGCSYTYGTDSVPNIKLIDKKNNDYAFGNFLGAKQVVNDAHPGSSNGGIVTRTVDWIEKHHKPDIAIIGWTSKNRICIPAYPYWDQQDRLKQHVLKNFEHYYIDEDVMEFQTVTNVIMLDAYLQNNGIQAYHFWAFDYVTHPFLDKISSRWLWPNSSWAREYNMALWKNDEPTLYHPNLEEHKRLAQDLKEFINGQN